MTLDELAVKHGIQKDDRVTLQAAIKQFNSGDRLQARRNLHKSLGADHPVVAAFNEHVQTTDSLRMGL